MSSGLFREKLCQFGNSRDAIGGVGGTIQTFGIVEMYPLHSEDFWCSEILAGVITNINHSLVRDVETSLHDAECDIVGFSELRAT